METEHKEGRCQKVDIVRQDAKARRNENRTNVEWILDISVRACHRQNLILLEMPCCPDANGLPQKDQNHPDQDPGELGFRKAHQQKGSDEKRTPSDLPLPRRSLVVHNILSFLLNQLGRNFFLVKEIKVS
jgi:hypothetical protein